MADCGWSKPWGYSFTMISRRLFLTAVVSSAAVGMTTSEAQASRSFFDLLKNSQKHHVKEKAGQPRVADQKSMPAPAYQGATLVDYASVEKPGTLIIKTQERALYRILGDGKAKRYGAAVGKEGFQWSGIARVGMKRENPMWTPPSEMIERKPEYLKWAGGMPGGLPINPLGPRAMYLYNKGDTGFRIHGTIHPESIGHAASSGCIRMLNREVIELFDVTRVGTKVIVI